jgi:putative ABC transport system ATP-binding protein
MKSLSLIDIKKVEKIYGVGENKVAALSDINFSIENGELVSIIGASGSGKTTLMNILGLLDLPTGGQYFLDGTDVLKMNDNQLSEIRNRKIGFVFQSFFLILKLSAQQNVMLPLLYRNMNVGEASKKALAMLDRFGIAKYANHRPNQLSGGQQQRVALARALVGEPEVVLADEPTGALDSKNSRAVMEQFIKLNEEEKRTLIIVTHDPHIADQCPRVIRILDGCLQEDVRHTPEELKQAREAYALSMRDKQPATEVSAQKPAEEGKSS